MKEVVICISPEGKSLTELHNLMVSVSEELESKQALVFPPHITIAHRIHTDKYDEMMEEISTVVQDVKSFKLTLNEMGFFKNPPVIYLMPKEKKQIKELHNLILPIVSKYNNGWIRESFLSSDFSGRQKAYLEKYGSPYVKEFFNTHLTLAGPDVNLQKFDDLIAAGFEEQDFVMSVDNVCSMVKINDEWKIDKRIILKE